jgi:hypothetical protein
MSKTIIDITARDYFAAKAMASLMHNFMAKDLHLYDADEWMEGLAWDAYRMADAMLKESKAGKGGHNE